VIYYLAAINLKTSQEWQLCWHSICYSRKKMVPSITSESCHCWPNWWIYIHY